MGIDQRQFAPGAERNREFILPILQRVLPATGTVLEIGSGTGEHAAFFAAQLPSLTWQPSEMDLHLHWLRFARVERSYRRDQYFPPVVL